MLFGLGVSACGAPLGVDDAGARDDAGTSADAGALDAGDPFADRVVWFDAGSGAGFGQDRFPQVVLGPPRGGGAGSGSLDVLSLGREGVIELEFTDIVAIDGPGVDVVVFENAFGGFSETGIVSFSDDGVVWYEFGCVPNDLDAGSAGCAGVNSVFSNPNNGISPLDLSVSGGDGFDLHDVGLTRARFVRIRDSGANTFYGAPSGGFDLDAVAVINGAK